MKIKYILPDDLLARKYAERNGLIPVGILGILRIACHRGAISLPQLKNNVNELISKHNLFVSQEVLDLYWNSFK
jgi:predicted nucleic acid-binding protein